jgi:hypothetical protein
MFNDKKFEVLDEKILSQSGCYSLVIRWVRGHHSRQNIAEYLNVKDASSLQVRLTHGHSGGPETEITFDRIQARTVVRGVAECWSEIAA